MEFQMREAKHGLPSMFRIYIPLYMLVLLMLLLPRVWAMEIEFPYSWIGNSNMNVKVSGLNGDVIWFHSHFITTSVTTA